MEVTDGSLTLAPARVCTSEAKVASRSRAASASFWTPMYFLGISLPLGHLHFCSWQQGGLGQIWASCVTGERC